MRIKISLHPFDRIAFEVAPLVIVDEAGLRNAGARRARTQFRHLRRRQWLVDSDEFPKVTAVLDKGPAGSAGLKLGDLMTKIDGRSVTNIADVLKRAGGLAPGGSVKLTVQRGETTKDITITTGEGI